MKYLAVDSDGTEWIFNYEIERHYGLATNNSELLICCEDAINKKSDFWTMKQVSKEFSLSYANRIELPKGSIFKLIGKTISWNDEPIEFK